jgi:hypothetical protein
VIHDSNSNIKNLELENQRRTSFLAKEKEERAEDRKIDRALRILEVPFREPYQELAFKDPRMKLLLDERMKTESADYKSEIKYWKDECKNWMKRSVTSQRSSLSLQTWAYSGYTERIADATSSTCIDLHQQGWTVTKCGIERKNQWEHEIQITAVQ